MDAAFYDPQITQRALEWINNQKQGSTPFREFLQDFEQNLLQAGGWEFPDEIRKGYLKAALALKIKEQLIAQEEPPSYADYVNLVRRVSDNLEEVERLKARHRKPAVGYTPQAKEDTGDLMDWEPSRVASGKRPNPYRTKPEGQTARWVPPEVLEKRRANQECLRCGSPDHFISHCRLAPAKRPVQPRSESRKAQVAASSPEDEPPLKRSGKKQKRKEPAKEPEESEWSSSDSGNE
jgi:hypothetical protein